MSFGFEVEVLFEKSVCPVVVVGAGMPYSVSRFVDPVTPVVVVPILVVELFLSVWLCCDQLPELKLALSRSLLPAPGGRPTDNLGTLTYLPHSSPNPLSTTKSPISAVGAYTAPN